MKRTYPGDVLPHLHRTVHAIKALGVKAGVVLNPSTPVGALEEIAADVDFVLVMSVSVMSVSWSGFW